MKKNIILGGLTLVSIFLASCSPSSESISKRPIHFVYVAWDGEIAATNVMKVVVEKMGYNVEIDSVSTPIMYKAIGSGQADAMFAAWLPTADQSYWEVYKNKVEDLGANYKGTRQGFVVPLYVEIDSIPELKDNKDKFKGKVYSIDPGAGTTLVSHETLEHYGLKDIGFELVEGSTPTMMASLKEAVRKGEWIAITGWSPHWMWKSFDLKYLDDPDLILGGSEEVHTLARKGLKEDFPDIYEVISNFHWTDEQMLPLLVKNEQGGDAYENAKEWVKENRDLVLSWIPEDLRDKVDL